LICGSIARRTGKIGRRVRRRVQHASRLVGSVADDDGLALTNGKGLAGLLGDPGLDIKEDVIKRPLRCLRIGVDLTHGRLPLAQQRRVGLGAAVGFADPAITGAAEIDELLVIRASDLHYPDKAPYRREQQLLALDLTGKLLRHGIATAGLRADGYRLGLKLLQLLAEDGIFALAAQELLEKLAVFLLRLVLGGSARCPGAHLELFNALLLRLLLGFDLRLERR